MEAVVLVSASSEQLAGDAFRRQDGATSIWQETGRPLRDAFTFTDHDLARFVHRHTDDKAQFDRALARGAPETIRLGRDDQGCERFTSLEMLAVERRLEDAAETPSWLRH
jgi:hypothetical protein